MGRRCGDIALQTGIATGATAILVPEVEYNIERDVIARIINTQKTGKKHFIVVVAEGVGGVRDLAKYIEKRLGIEARATILGHVQRGGSPSVRDRVVASQMGYEAVDLLDKGYGNRVVVMRDGKITHLDINEALDMKRVFDKKLYEIAMSISI
jgi:6-phosphofructokinase 1